MNNSIEAPFHDIDIPIGTKFTINRGRSTSRDCEVVDIFKTYDHQGELRYTRYICQYEFMGQRCFLRDVVKFTIQKALMNNKD